MNQARALRRARSLIDRHISWLSGYPLERTAEGLVWQVVPHVGAPYLLLVDSRRLHDTMRIWSKLSRRFVRVRSLAVPDFDHWERAIPRLLKLLGRAHNDGAPLPATPNGRSTGDRLKDRLAWKTYLWPDETTAGWVENYFDRLAVVRAREGELAAMMLCELVRRDGSETTERLVQIGAGVPVLGPEVGKQYYLVQEHLLHLSMGAANRNTLPGPSDRVSVPIKSFMVWLLDQPERARRTYLELLALMLPADFFETWHQWHEQLDQFNEKLRYFSQAEDKASAGRLLGTMPEAPLEYSVNEMLYWMQHSPCPQQWPELLIPYLPALPFYAVNRLLRFDLAQIGGGYASAKHGLQLLELWLKRMLDASMAAHTLAMLRKGKRSIELSLFDHLGQLFNDWPHEQRSLAFDLLSAAAERIPAESFNAELAERLLEMRLIAANAGIDAAIGCFLNDQPDPNRFVTEKQLYLAYLIGGEQHFADIITRLDELITWEEPIAHAWIDFVKTAERIGWHDLVCRLMRAGQDGTLHRLVLTRLALADFGIEPPLMPPPLPEQHPDWIGHYPAEFAPLLATLAEVTVRAESIAARILGKQFPQPHALRQELAVLLAKADEWLGDEWVPMRIANLQQRLAEPATPTLHVREKLAAKLTHALYMAVFQRWQTQTDGLLRAHLEQLVAPGPLPERYYDPELAILIAAIVRLKAPYKQLGLRFVRDPQAFLDEPANRRFIRRMRAAKLRLDAWLNPAPPIKMRAANGRKLWIGITTDPVDILMMGNHFNTCLSIEGGNFYSTISNGIDVNKQLLYARDMKQQVVGRCLLALSDSGGLLTFHPYCHDQSVELGELVGRFAVDLADKLNTVVVSRGRVAPLVAPSWYDDGAIDLVGQFRFLAPISPFVQRLPQITPERFTVELAELLAPLPIGPITIPIALYQRPVLDRDDLIVTFIPYVQRLKGYTTETLLILGLAAARQQVHPEFVERVIKDRCLPLLRRYAADVYHLQLDALRLITLVHPSQGLRLLRRTREGDVNHDLEDRPERRAILALAHERLNRPELAAKLLEAQSAKSAMYH